MRTQQYFLRKLYGKDYRTTLKRLCETAIWIEVQRAAEDYIEQEGYSSENEMSRV